MEQRMTFEQLLERDGHLAFTNKGVSMLPLLRQGKDVMLLEKKSATPLKKFDCVLFRRAGKTQKKDAYVMHRILRVNDDGTYWIVGDNCISGETVAEKQIIGILKGIIRNGKTFSLKRIDYQIYVNTWCRWYHLRFGLLRTRQFVGKCLRKTGLRK